MRRIAKNSMVGRVVKALPKYFEAFFEEESVLEYIQLTREKLWDWLRIHFPTRSYIKAWTTREDECVTEHCWQVTKRMPRGFIFIPEQVDGIIPKMIIEEDTRWPKHMSSDELGLVKNRHRDMGTELSKAFNRKLGRDINFCIPMHVAREAWDEDGKRIETQALLMHELIARAKLGPMDHGFDQRYLDHVVRTEVQKVNYEVFNALKREACLKWFGSTSYQLFTKIWKHFMFKILDRDALRAATSIKGAHVKVSDYNKLIISIDTVREAHSLNPQVVSLWAMVSGAKCTRPLHKVMKRALKAHGMTKGGWKYFLKLPITGLGELLVEIKNTSYAAAGTIKERERLQRQILLGKLARSMNLLSQTGEVPRYTIMHWINTELCEASNLVEHDVKIAFISVMRALFKATKKERISVRWHKKTYADTPLDERPRLWRNRVRDVVDWMTRDGIVALNRDQRRMSWTGFERMCRVWHDQFMHQRHLNTYGNLAWESRIDVFTAVNWPDLRAVALVNSEALFEEGNVMGHCVSQYVQRCAQGRCRLFSIRKIDKEGEEKRVSTLEITCTGMERKWEVIQHRGKFNSDQVSNEQHLFVKVLVTEYNKVQEGPEEEKRLDPGPMRLGALGDAEQVDVWNEVD